MVYHFSHSGLDDEVEEAMADGMPPTKDINQDGHKYLYSGAAKYRGLGKDGSTSAADAFPANVPFLENKLMFKLAPEAADDIMHCNSKYWDLTSKANVEEILKKGTRWSGGTGGFPENFTLTWDYSMVRT